MPIAYLQFEHFYICIVIVVNVSETEELSFIGLGNLLQIAECNFFIYSNYTHNLGIVSLVDTLEGGLGGLASLNILIPPLKIETLF